MAAPVLPGIMKSLSGSIPGRASASSRPRMGRMICSCTSQTSREVEPRKGQAVSFVKGAGRDRRPCALAVTVEL